MHMHRTELDPRLVCSICFFLSVTPFLCRPASTMGKLDCQTKDFLMAKEPKQWQRNRNNGKGTKTKTKAKERCFAEMSRQKQGRGRQSTTSATTKNIITCSINITIVMMFLNQYSWNHGLEALVGSVSIEDSVVPQYCLCAFYCQPWGQPWRLLLRRRSKRP